MSAGACMRCATSARTRRGRSARAASPSGRPLDDAEQLITDDGALLRCPWRLWEFEIATGRCVADASLRVKTYPVVVEEG
jgi:nitrite reductase/ring-hydroxylating ferredoxin subunit